jgi:hypothetical protein
MKRLQTIATLAAAGALLALPAVGDAHHRAGHTQGGGGQNGTPGCKKPTVNKGFVVKGTLVSITADNPATQANELSVTITVTKQNRHASRSDLTDASASTDGLQYKIDDADDDFRLKLSGFEGTDTPSPGDAVRIVGKVKVTKKKCAPENATLADRYGDVNVRQVKVADRDPDA